MPNWVYNSLSNYDKSLIDKYGSKDRDIDFEKIIPEPEEIKNTVSGSVPDTAKKIYQFTQYMEELSTKENIDYNQRLRWDQNNPLRNTIKGISENTTQRIGEVAIENPNKSLNQLFKKDEYKYEKGMYDTYVSIFGNKRYSKCDLKQAHENYIKNEEKQFQKTKNDSIDSDIYKKHATLVDYGKHLVGLKEKYGYDNWYNWQCDHWGTKWNACDTDYDEETKTLKFDTAWSIPYPIIAKIAQDNPSAKLDGYSEEETGWFEEYNTEDGKVSITASGAIEYDEDKDEPYERKETFEHPKVFDYDQIMSDGECYF